jgi:DNA-binding NarL/FixJ family response regulator
MKTVVSVIIVDDNIQFRKNLKKYIESELNCEVIGEASDGEEFLELTNMHSADIILMDIAMERMDGFRATKLAIWKNSQLKIIAVTMHHEKVFLLKLIETGFKGCVFKTEIFKQLPKAIKEVLKGKLFVPDNIPIDEK